MGPVVVRVQMVWSIGTVIYEPGLQKLRLWQKCCEVPTHWIMSTNSFQFLNWGPSEWKLRHRLLQRLFLRIKSWNHRLIKSLRLQKPEDHQAFNPAPPPFSPLSHTLQWHIHTFFSNSRDGDSIKSVTISYIATTLCCQFLWHIEQECY